MASKPIKDIKPEEIKQVIDLLVSLGYEVKGTDDVIRSISSVTNKLKEQENAWDKSTEKLQNFQRTLNSIGGAFTAVTNGLNKIGGSFGANAINFSNAIDASIKYKDTIVSNSAEFIKLGGSVKGYEESLGRLRDRFGATTEQVAKLMSTTSNIFVGMKIDVVNKHMENLYKHFRGNTEAAANFNAELKNAVKTSLDLQKMLERGASVQQLASEAAAQAMAAGDYEKAEQFFTEAARVGGTAADQARLDELNKPIEQNRKVTAQFEKAAQEMGDQLLSIRTKLIETAGGIDNFAAALAKATQTSAFASESIAMGLAGIGGFVNAAASIGEIFMGGGRLARGNRAFAARALRKVGAKKAAGGLVRGAGKVGLGAAVKGGAKLLGSGAKALGKGVVKKIPVLGAVAGAAFAYDRFMGGDLLGAVGELASGVASVIPGFGTAASVAIDAGLAARDAANAMEGAAEGAEEAADASAKVDESKKEKDQSPSVKSLGAENDKRREIGIKQAALNKDIAIQKNLLDSIQKLNDSQFKILTAAGNFRAAEVAMGRELLSIDEQKIKNAQLLVLAENELALARAAGNPDLIRMVEQKINEIKGEGINLTNREVELGTQRIGMQDKQLELLNAQVGTMQAELNLIDNMGMGLGASVEARQRMVEMHMQEAQMQRDAAARAEQQMLQKRREAEDMTKSEDERNKAGAAALEYEKQFEERRTKTLEATSKAAELTKKMREGWIESIAFMTTGAGAFTRIIVSQNANLGILDKTRRDMIETIKYGGTAVPGGYKTQSDRFASGTLEIASSRDARSDQILSNQGINITDRDIRNLAIQEHERQRRTAGTGVGPAAAFGAGPQGLGAVPLNEGMTTIGKPQQGASSVGGAGGFGGVSSGFGGGAGVAGISAESIQAQKTREEAAIKTESLRKDLESAKNAENNARDDVKKAEAAILQRDKLHSEITMMREQKKKVEEDMNPNAFLDIFTSGQERDRRSAAHRNSLEMMRQLEMKEKEFEKMDQLNLYSDLEQKQKILNDVNAKFKSTQQQYFKSKEQSISTAAQGGQQSAAGQNATVLNTTQMASMKDSLVTAFTQIVSEVRKEVLTNIKQAVS
jgi:hypothetical protein